MSIPTRYRLLEDAKPADARHWYWPLPRLAGDAPRVIGRANDHRCGLDLGYQHIAFPDLFVPVFAARSGTISFAACVTTGCALTIDHGGVWSTHYAHLDKMFVPPTLGRRRRRTYVRGGDVIGYAARQPSHIRFELWQWTARGGFAAIDATPMMEEWLVLPQFTTVVERASGAGAAA
jgi:murein DD-endopeptidase MepM/ murein hydrolase activator NlpD